MSERNNDLILDDIVQCIIKINRYTDNIDEGLFLTDEMLQDAVCRNFGIMGEAAARLNQEFKLKNSHIDWRSIKDFRNHIIHDYISTDYRQVWSIIQKDLPILLKHIQAILS